MQSLKSKYNQECRETARVEDFCAKILPDSRLSELERKRLPYFLISLFCLILNFSSIIANIVLFVKRNEWDVTNRANDIILAVFILTILVIIITYKAYCFMIKKAVMLDLLKFIGNFKFGDKSKAKFMLNEIKKEFPFYLECHCTDRYTGKYKDTNIDIAKITLSRFRFIPHIFGTCFDGFLIRVPYNRKAIGNKPLARRDEGIDDIKITLNKGFVCIIVSSPRKIWFTFSLLFSAKNRIVYNNILKEIITLTRIIDNFVPEI